MALCPSPWIRHCLLRRVVGTKLWWLEKMISRWNGYLQAPEKLLCRFRYGSEPLSRLLSLCEMSMLSSQYRTSSSNAICDLHRESVSKCPECIRRRKWSFAICGPITLDGTTTRAACVRDNSLSLNTFKLGTEAVDSFIMRPATIVRTLSEAAVRSSVRRTLRAL